MVAINMRKSHRSTAGPQTAPIVRGGVKQDSGSFQTFNILAELVQVHANGLTAKASPCALPYPAVPVVQGGFPRPTRAQVC
jgi:hypothetical protein